MSIQDQIDDTIELLEKSNIRFTYKYNRTHNGWMFGFHRGVVRSNSNIITTSFSVNGLVIRKPQMIDDHMAFIVFLDDQGHYNFEVERKTRYSKNPSLVPIINECTYGTKVV